jgi:hypothetical protein
MVSDDCDTTFPFVWDLTSSLLEVGAWLFFHSKEASMTSLAEPRPRSDVWPACSLGSAELADRVSEWHSLRDDALTAETVRDGVVVAVFARSPDVMRRLQAVIKAEASCCPFLGFKICGEDDRVTVEVTAAAPAKVTVPAAPPPQGPRGGCR